MKLVSVHIVIDFLYLSFFEDVWPSKYCYICNLDFWKCDSFQVGFKVYPMSVKTVHTVFLLLVVAVMLVFKEAGQSRCRQSRQWQWRCRNTTILGLVPRPRRTVPWLSRLLDLHQWPVWKSTGAFVIWGLLVLQLKSSFYLANVKTLFILHLSEIVFLLSFVQSTWNLSLVC